MLAFDLPKGKQPQIQVDLCPTASGTADVGTLRIKGTIYFVDGLGSPSLGGGATEWVAIYTPANTMGVGSFVPKSGGTPNDFDYSLNSSYGSHVSYVGLAFVLNSGWFGTVFIDNVTIY